LPQIVDHFVHDVHCLLPLHRISIFEQKRIMCYGPSYSNVSVTGLATPF
jgi:hypothetical protein